MAVPAVVGCNAPEIVAAKLSAEVLNYPHFWLGLALALAGVLAVIHFTRPQ